MSCMLVRGPAATGCAGAGWAPPGGAGAAGGIRDGLVEK